MRSALAHKALPHNPACLLCAQTLETMQHLLVHYLFARDIWHEVMPWFRASSRGPDPGETLIDWWLETKQRTSKERRKGLASTVLLTSWMIWKHRDACTFSKAQPNDRTLLSDILLEGCAWVRARAAGLAACWPEGWDSSLIPEGTSFLCHFSFFFFLGSLGCQCQSGHGPIDLFGP